jgi:hypothetical protein
MKQEGGFHKLHVHNTDIPTTIQMTFPISKRKKHSTPMFGTIMDGSPS